MNDSKLGYRVKEAAACLSIGVWKLKQEMYQGRIRYIKGSGSRVVIPRWSLEERLRPENTELVNEWAPGSSPTPMTSGFDEVRIVTVPRYKTSRRDEYDLR